MNRAPVFVDNIVKTSFWNDGYFWISIAIALFLLFFLIKLMDRQRKDLNEVCG